MSALDFSSESASTAVKSCHLLQANIPCERRRRHWPFTSAVGPRCELCIAELSYDKPTVVGPRHHLRLRTSSTTERSCASAAMQQAQAYAFTGAAGGAAAAAMMHPLDVLRVRLAVQDASLLHADRARGVLACIADIYTHEGLRGFMRGVGPATLAVGSSWGLFELAREAVVRPWRAVGAHGTQGMSQGQVMATSVAASALIAPLMNPLFLAKTRMQTALMERRGGISSPTSSGRGAGISRTLLNILRADGVRGMMIGLGPGLLNTLTGGVQQVAIHTFKEWGGHAAGGGSGGGGVLVSLLPFLGGVGAATLAGRVAAMTVLYPVQVVRTRMQQMPPGSQGGHAPVSVAHNPYRSIAGTVRLMWGREGVGAFYKGFTPSLLRGGMQASVAASIIETGKAVYHRWEGGR